MSKKKGNWFRVFFQLKSSVIPTILPQIIVCGGFGFLISLLYYLGLPVSWPMIKDTVVPGIFLALLLVFRTNTGYERFWEGRKMWGNLIVTARNLSRQIWIAIEEQEPKDREQKLATLRLMVAFAVVTKLYLRQEPVNSELEGLMSPSQHFTLKNLSTPALEIAFWIGDYLQQQYRRNCLNTNQLVVMQNLLDDMVKAFTSCERIVKTPMPLAYAIHLKQLSLIYCLALPFTLVKDFSWFTGLVVALISFALFGIEQIGIEIEDPFGRNPHDLPLDEMCNTMRQNIEDLSRFATDSAYAPTQIF